MVAVTIELDERHAAMVDDWVREGLYASRAEVIAAGIHFVDREVREASWTPSPEDWDAINRGLDDVKAGRVRPADEVFDELLQRYRDMAARS